MQIRVIFYFDFLENLRHYDLLLKFPDLYQFYLSLEMESKEHPMIKVMISSTYTPSGQV